MFRAKHWTAKSPQVAVKPEEIAIDACGRIAASKNLPPRDFDRDRFIARIARFAATLAVWGRRMNLTARPDDPVETAFHVIDSLAPVTMALGVSPGALEGAFAHGRRILDLGSGAGFPGLIIAAATDATVTLVESRRRRAGFLDEAIVAMELPNARVLATRVQAGDLAADYDAMTARALGPTFFELAAAALRPGGIAILYAAGGQRIDEPAGVRDAFEPAGHMSYQVERGRGQRASRALHLWRRR
jgi:16S rRNA (guanine(527)-N(7))-methyltransferase RsmG